MRRLSLLLFFSSALIYSGQTSADIDEEMESTDPIEQVEPTEQPDILEESDPIEQSDALGEKSLPKKAEVITPAEPIRYRELRPGEGTSEVIFDWNKHQNESNVKHPFAPKGLTTITKNKEYLYKVNESAQKNASSLRVGVFQPLELKNPDDDGPGSTFEENYDETNSPMLMFDYEWQLWRTPVGKWGLRAGTGLYIAQGNGHFVAGPNAGKVPREIFTFWAMPHTIGAVYRMQFFDKQLLVPYGEGGASAITFGEFRDDGKPPRWGGALAAYFAGGLALNLTYFDATSRIQLDREYGINRIYFTGEYRMMVGLTRYDFSSDLINAGFLAEF